MPNIERRANRWYATLHVPPDVRDTLGKSKFLQSLKTTDKRVAERRAGVLIPVWKEQIAAARGGAPDTFIADALMWRHEYQTNEAKLEVRDLIIQAAKERQTDGPTFYRIATGLSEPLQPHIEPWLSTLSLTPKTIAQMRSDAARLLVELTTVEQLTTEAVKSWLKSFSDGPKPLSKSSIKRLLSSCRSLWAYLQEQEVVPADKVSPFVLPKNLRNGSHTSSWRPFTASEAVSLFNAAIENEDQDLANLIQFGMYTGARIEEICSLSVADVRDGKINIREAKTAAGIRTIPIHSKLAPLVERLTHEPSPASAAQQAAPETTALLTERATDDRSTFLLKNLKPNKYGDRSAAIGKRFGRLKKSLGFGELHVFHSLRKTVVTLLENAGVSENLTADIVGHQKPRITYGLYSGGHSIDVMRDALERLSYPDSSKVLSKR